jgi:hypothetical protein
VDIWHGCLSMSRQYLRDWNANKASEGKRKMMNLLTQLKALDVVSEQRDVDREHWEKRYALEKEMEIIYHKEDLYWQQRGRENWILRGDANTSFFHSVVNGRRRKTKICSLEAEGGLISNQQELSAHIVKFYKNLFGSFGHKGVHLAANFWMDNEVINDLDREILEAPFSEKDVLQAIAGMKIESALGPNGFTVIFYKRMWV